MADSRERASHSLAENAAAGVLAGVGLFALELSIRLPYLWLTTFERAPEGYATFLLLYAAAGLAGGIALHVLIGAAGALRRRGQGRWLAAAAALVAAAVAVSLRRLLAGTELQAADVLGHLALLVAGAAGFLVLFRAVRSIRARLGTARTVAAWTAAVLVLAGAHQVLLARFTPERIFTRLPASRPGTGLPNVILLTVDTLRADRLGAYGNPDGLTPNLDRLAAEGTLLSDTVAASSWTRPSYASVLTSRYPSQHGAFVVNDPDLDGYHADWGDMLYNAFLRDEVVTLPEVLSAEGYTTIALQANWQVSDAQNFDQGFTAFLYSELFRITLWDRSLLGVYGSWLPALVGAERRLPYYTVAPGADEVWQSYRALVHRGLPEPFFLWINLMDPHSPYLVRRPDAAGVLRVTGSYETWDDAIPFPELLAAYDDEVRFVDRHVGKMAALLGEVGLLDRTLLVFTADHGEEFGEHAARIHFGDVEVHGRHHGHSLYDELTHVPLFLRFPGRVSAGRLAGETGHLIDVMPTILDLAGVSPESGMEGASLLAREGDPDGRPAYAFSERLYFGLERKAIQDGRYKLILDFVSGNTELYDRLLDPAERHDVSEELPEVTARLRKELDAWMERMGPLLPAWSAEQARLTETQRRRLESLGYLD